MKNKKYIDLQIHSDYSDGLLSPRRIIERAKKNNLAVIALTDHCAIDGVAEATTWGQKLKIKVIPAVEFYITFKNKDLHILGYNIDLKNKALIDTLKIIQRRHRQKVAESVKKLKKIGFTINFSEIIRTKSKYIGLVRIVSNLWKSQKNRQKIRRQIKNRYLTLPLIAAEYFIRGQPAYLPQENIPAAKAIKLIQNARGLPVLAHPGQQLSWNDDNLIKDLKKIGLKGLEVFSPYHTWHQVEHYQKAASQLNLIPTGGSDFHGDLSLAKGEFIKNQWDYFHVPYRLYLNFRKRRRI